MTLFDGPYSICTIEINRDEDWSDTVVLQRLNADGSITNFDFSQIIRLELFIRPVFDHSILIRKLSSDLSSGGELQYSTSVPGTFQIVVSRANVIAGIPTGTWNQFLIATYGSGSITEFWRGPLIVHPGKTP
jgi:hypothetical protein